MNVKYELRENTQPNLAYATSDFFQLVSQSFQLPTIELAEALIDGRYFTDGISILKDLSDDQEDVASLSETMVKVREILKGTEPTQLSKQMRREYSRLFYHPKSPVIGIYETTFIDNQTNKESTLFLSPIAVDVESCYKEAGVSIQNQSREPADYLCTELEFMMYLFYRKGKAISNEEHYTLTTVTEQIRQFEHEHAEKWFISFFNEVEKYSSDLLYQMFAQLAKVGLRKILF